MQCLGNWLGVPSTHIRSSALPAVTPSLTAAASWHRTITQAAKQEQPRTPKQPLPPKVGRCINTAVCNGTEGSVRLNSCKPAGLHISVATASLARVSPLSRLRVPTTIGLEWNMFV